jgi:hypothetical protein
VEGDDLAKRDMRRVKTVIGVLLGILVACFVLIGVLYGLALRHRERAREYLREFTALRLGESTFADAQLLARKHQGIPWYVAEGDMRCTFQKCSFVFKFENMPLAYIPFVRHTELFAEILVENGIVVSRQLEYERNSGSDYYFRYLVVDSLVLSDNPSEYGQGYGVWRLKVDPTGIAHTLLVKLGPLSKTDERSRAYSLDLSCLARLYGCNSPSSFYPQGTPYSGSSSGGQVSSGP